MPFHLAIVGSGPAGYYAAEAATKRWPDAVEIDIIDRLPAPFGLIRSGVAPDHQSIKAVSRRFEAVHAPHVRLLGNVRVGEDVAVTELLELYDAVVLATGAPHDRPLGVPGQELAGVVGSAAFVGWYNGHFDFAALAPSLGPEVAIVGAGNVALDCARILAKTPAELAQSDIAAHARAALADAQIERITIVARRGPHQIAMTPKELGELGKLTRAQPLIDPADLPEPAADAALEPGLRKSVALLREFAATPRAAGKIPIVFDFFAQPAAVTGAGRVAQLEVERTELDTNGAATAAGERYVVPADLVISCIGYRTSPIAGVPYDEARGRFANEEGRIAERLYCVGWARRGPSGTIGTNRPDGFGIIDKVAAEVAAGRRPGGAGLRALLGSRGVDTACFDDWKRIEAAEIGRAQPGAPREKFTDLAEMLAAR